MKSVSINELKIRLSFWANKASKGETICVTKFNKPLFSLVPVHTDGLIWGDLVGEPHVSLKNASTHGKYLEYLEEDRNEDN